MGAQYVLEIEAALAGVPLPPTGQTVELEEAWLEFDGERQPVFRLRRLEMANVRNDLWSAETFDLFPFFNPRMTLDIGIRPCC